MHGIRRLKLEDFFFDVIVLSCRSGGCYTFRGSRLIGNSQEWLEWVLRQLWPN